MASEINVAIGQTGLALTGRLYFNGVINPNVITLSEVAGAGGLYIGNMPAVAAGAYEIMFYANGVLRASGAIEWDGAAEVTLASRLATNDSRLVNLDAPISLTATGTALTAAANAILAAIASVLGAVGAIPTNPLLTNDARLNNLDAKISLTATAAGLTAGVNSILTAINTALTAIGAIPINPLLTNDPRLDNLDAKISLTATGAALAAAVTTILAAIGALPSPLDQWLTDLVSGGYSGDEAGAIVLDLLAALQDVQNRLPLTLIDGHMDAVFMIPDTCADDGAAATAILVSSGSAPFL